MVYGSDYYTTRSYSRPIVRSSYAVTYPIYSSRVHTYPTYPIYSYKSIPYISRSRIISSPIRSIYSPIRTIYSPSRYIYSSPRVITTRITTSPVRVIRSPTPLRYYSSPSDTVVISSSRRSYSPAPVISYARTGSTVLSREYERIANKYRPSISNYVLDKYLNSDAVVNFDMETRRIRNDAQALLRDIHSPVRRARSYTPFYTSRVDPISDVGLSSYVSRITNPSRYLIKDIDTPSYYYPETTHRYVGKSHLASVRILGDRGYTTRNPLYNYDSPDKIRKDVELLSFYLKNRRAASEVSGKTRSSAVEAIEASN